jgi:hypothetical protein
MLDWKKQLDALRATQSEAVDGMKSAVEQTIGHYWPKAQELFSERIGPFILANARDDERLKPLSRVVYDALPLPARLVVSEEAFTRFCLSNRDRLLPPGPCEKLEDRSDQSEAAIDTANAGSMTGLPLQ